MDEIDRRVARAVLKALSVSFVFVVVGPPVGLLAYGAVTPAPLENYFAAALVLSYLVGFVPALTTGVIYALIPRELRNAITAALIGGAVTGILIGLVVIAWGVTTKAVYWDVVLLPVLQLTAGGALAAAMCSGVVSLIGLRVRTAQLT